MEAQPKPHSVFTRPRVVRLVAVWLLLVLALGLWQGYGAWWPGGEDVR